MTTSLETQPLPSRDLRRALATIALGLSHSDGSFAPSEARSLIDGLQERLALPYDELLELLHEANELRQADHGTQGAVRLLVANLPASDWEWLAKYMSSIIFADGKVASNEIEYATLVWRTARALVEDLATSHAVGTECHDTNSIEEAR